MERLAVVTVECAELGPADSHRVRQHGFEHRFQIALTGRNDAQHVRRRGLLLLRLGQIAPERGDIRDGGRAAAAARARRSPAWPRLAPSCGRLAPPRLHCFVCASTWIGSVKLNTEPLPSSDSTQSLPPCSSTMRREIDRPRPVPPFFLVAELSACWNSSKILPWSVVEMPGPLSFTATVNEPLVELALMITAPVSLNLMALPTRFSTTWVSRRSS